MKRTLALLFGVLFLIGCWGCSKADPQKLKVGVMSDFDSIPFFVAEAQKYFADNVELVLFRSPTERDAALNAGELDGTISDVLSVCQLRDKGFNVKITSATNGAYGIISREELSSPKDLEGKSVAISFNSIIEYFLDTSVAAAGGDPTKVDKQAVPQMPSRIELLKSGQIDAIVVPEPYVSAVEADGYFVLKRSGEVTPGVFLFTEKALADKSAEIKKFYAAYDKAVKYIGENDKKNWLPAVLEKQGVPETAINAILPNYTAHKLLPDDELDRAQDWLLDKKPEPLTKKRFDKSELNQNP